MARPANDQPARLVLLSRNGLDSDLQEFLLDREARNVSPKTLLWYRQSLDYLRSFLQTQRIENTEQITASDLRRFLLALKEQGHNPGGVRNIWGAIKSFLRWFENESAPDGWRNPLRKVQTPKCPEKQMQPVPLADLRKMLATCQRRTLTGDRDRAILLALLDTGCRAAEFTALNVGEVNLGSGGVLVREGKGRKFRTVFLGARSRRELLRYLRQRGALGDSAPLWATRQGTRLTYAGLRQTIRRRAKRAGVAAPSLHSFRHAFAIACLRSGVDLVSLQRMLGHADFSILRRYLAQTTADLQQAHARGGPVDHLL